MGIAKDVAAAAGVDLLAVIALVVAVSHVNIIVTILVWHFV